MIWLFQSRSFLATNADFATRDNIRYFITFQKNKILRILKSRPSNFFGCTVVRRNFDLLHFFQSITRQPTSLIVRACVCTGARHGENFRPSRLAPGDFEVLCSNWHRQALFYRIDSTRSFKFLTQPLIVEYGNTGCGVFKQGVQN